MDGEDRHAGSHLGKDAGLNPLKRSAKTEEYVRWTDRDTYQYWSEMYPIPDDNKIIMCVPPSWGIVFPPYNLSRLTALLRSKDYEVKVYDTNIDSYHYLKDKLDWNPWDSIYWDKWILPAYPKLHVLLEPFFDELIREIVDDPAQYVGFSLYSTNLLATSYIAKRIKEFAPHKTIIVGGPEAFQKWWQEPPERYIYHPEHITSLLKSTDVLIIGEGEEELLNYLQTADQYPQKTGKVIYRFGGQKSRLDLNQLPFPDYSDYDLSKYERMGVSLETSRGCVAKCSFCSETHFWKFRSRTSSNVVDEIDHQVKTYGTKRFWFVDSLVNGNMKEFKNIVYDIVDRELDIAWNSYARCDGRMDLEFFHAIKKSGCGLLSFGVESGSQKVLDDMQKKIDVWEIEANLRDCREADIESHVNWVIGFPTEGPQEWCHSLNVLYNCRNWITVISPGMTCGDAPLSDMNTNWQKYDMAWLEEPWDNKFLSNWFTKDYKSTIMHRFIRLKYANYFLWQCIKVADGTVINAQARPTLQEFITFEQNNPGQFADYIHQEADQGFDVFSGETSQTNLAATLSNEHLPHMWMMYKAFGGHKFTMFFDPDKDYVEFGSQLSHMLWGEVEWQVEDNGDFKFKCWFKFDHETRFNIDDGVAIYEVKREDMSFDRQDFTLEGNMSMFDGEVINVGK